MSPRLLAITLILLLVLGEVGLGVWRNLPLVPSTAPVFAFPPAAVHFAKPGALAKEIAEYGADRGAQIDLTDKNGTRVSLIYFEWDSFRVRPLMDIAFHAPEYCNTRNGYHLVENAGDQVHVAANGSRLVFDTTKFTDRAGNDVYMFKTVWFQGMGSMAFREQGFDRPDRLHKSFIRHQGAARVLQAGVFDAQGSGHAWKVFQEEVLTQLVWK